MSKSAPSVLALVVRSDGRVLSISRRNDREDFGFPGGKVDQGETPEQALIREVLEETGVRILRVGPLVICRPGCGLYRVLEWEGVAHEAEGDAAVEWLDAADLLAASKSFPHFNRAALTAARLIPRSV